jgi:NTE family protein
MKTYAILAGGGVKGIALAGCLAAAEEKGVEFQGYGGTSAGSIVALLGSVGYRGSEIREFLKNESFTNFLDDGGAELERLKRLATLIFEKRWFKSARVARRLFSERTLLKRLYSDSGLYSASNLERFVREKVKERFPELEDDFQFADLHRAGAKLLKIVAADVVRRKSLVFSSNGNTGESDWSVITALRASISYPYVFRPVQMHTSYLTDGGISSNLPVFLFEEERKSNKLPVLAFDLIVPSTKQPDTNYKLFKFSQDVLMTTMESSDKLLQGLITGLNYIPVKVPSSIDTLKFSLSPDEQTALYLAGYEAAMRYLDQYLSHWFRRTGNRIAELQAQRAVRPETVERLLGVLARDFEQNTAASAIRCAIMMPTGTDTQIVVYTHGMSGYPDADLEIDLSVGYSGKALSLRTIGAADLVEGTWGLSVNERARIPGDRRAALSIPLFDVSSSVAGKIDSASDRLLGTLNLDTVTSLADTSWGEVSTFDKRFVLTDKVKKLCLLWGEVFSRLLS